MISAQAQVNRWDEVAQLEKQSLPASALEVVNRIYQEALNSGNTPDLLKALIYQLKYETAIDNDVLPDRIREIEQFAGTEKDQVGQAVLYSLLSEIYTNYYQANAYSINQRTEIAGDAPEDSREWSKNLFIRKTTELVRLSLRPVSELQRTTASAYKEILIEGESSRELRPTLYDFLLEQGIQTLTQYGRDEFYSTVLELYGQWLEFRKVQAATGTPHPDKGVLMIELERLEFIRNHPQSGNSDAEYIQALSELEEQYKKADFCVEILYREAEYYWDKFHQENQTEWVKKAYDICLNGLETYPSYNRKGLLQNFLNDITQRSLTVISENTVYPGQALKLTVNYKNIHRLTVEIYRIEAPVSIYPNSWEREGQYKKSGNLFEKREFDLKYIAPYLEEDTILQVPVKELGNYEYVIYAAEMEDNPANRQFSVSRLATIARAVDDKREYLVADRMTGKPLDGVQLRFYTQKNGTVSFGQEVRTGKDGLAVEGDAKELVFYNASFKNDTALILSPLPWISTYRDTPSNTVRLSLFTDRSIYRPGQTVYFKGIAFEMGVKVEPDKAVTIFFRDANGKEIANQKLKTNAFGSFNGEFVIPQGALNGNFTIQSDANGGYATIKVEEYKRPTFDIQFAPNNATCQFGDTVTVKGTTKTFSGVNLQNMQLRYRIMRRNHWLFRMPYFPPTLIAEGSVQTQSDGSFAIHFPADKAAEDYNRPNVYYTYTVEATVTDSNGETQTSNTSLSVGDKSMYLTINGLDDVVDKGKKAQAVTINTFNLSGNPVPAQGTYEIYSLKAKDNTHLDADAGNWIQDQSIGSNDFVSGKELVSTLFQGLTSGRYRLIAKALDSNKNEIITQQDFTVASASDKRPPIPVYEWLMTPKTTCAVGEKAEIIYGSSAKEVYVLYELFKANKKISASRFILNNENRKIEIPFLESYGDGITASFCFIKDGQVFTKNVSIYKKQEDKTLNLKMEVFRDRLLPGQTEEWKLSVKDTEKNPVVAELLAGMYDASLDKIYAHAWNFNPVRTVNLWTPYNRTGNEFNVSNGYAYKTYKAVQVRDFTYDVFNWFGFDVRSRGNGMMLRSVQGVKEVGVDIADLQDHKVVVQEESVPAFYAMASVDKATVEQEQPVQIRQNFKETAFFYPQLKTNEAGETLISFTVPESNTTWRFMGLAHTKDLKFGQIVQEAISQKKLMVTPNIPRFLRAGDRATILSNISNLTDQTIIGTTTIDFFDPVTNQSVITVTGHSQPFTVEAGQTVPVRWTFDVPDSLDLTGIRIVAASTDFSDGEQHLLPILPNRMLVTESLPLNVLGGQTRTYPLAPLFGKTSSTMEEYRVTLEFTSNPAWYAIQALPTVTTPQTDNVLSWFAAYYANTMAARIAKSAPNIQQMIETWAKQSNNSETLLSRLEKNQELKAVLLEETPWVLEAENESAQKQRLVSLFDDNRINYVNKQALEKLQSLQTGDGGWSWFKGMDGNVSITQWILYGMANLGPENGNGMIENAVAFIDRQFKKHFDDLKKRNSKEQPSYSFSTYELEYLFVRSYYKDIPFGNTEEAAQFYTGLIEKDWTKNTDLYGRALAALIMQRNGHTKTAQAILKSLREHASRKPDLGIYWANNNTRSFMTQSAVCVHTFIMEAFRETGSTQAEMDEMKLWLLKQKQTQEWESVPATVNAIDMLLKTGSNWLASQNDVIIRLGAHPLSLGSSEPGTGYLKELKGLKTPETLTVTKEGSGPAWGALYRQYFEDLDKITAAKTGLNVEKSFIAPNDRALQVGDKVTIRLTVRADRDMEYVLLKDLRASCLEPVDQLSGVRWKQGVAYYQSPKDASMNFFFPALPKGTYVFEYNVYVTAPGDYSNGITTIQCMYAPEFVSHTAGERVKVQ
ncbi:hypothetical protein FACS1894182_06920 [Bacteroidia bacterium]|nr:hypothetical protein FACS1894182_06920 [Bacteroidia bacterium]